VPAVGIALILSWGFGTLALHPINVLVVGGPPGFVVNTIPEMDLPAMLSCSDIYRRVYRRFHFSYLDGSSPAAATVVFDVTGCCDPAGSGCKAVLISRPGAESISTAITGCDLVLRHSSAFESGLGLDLDLHPDEDPT
jgi:hypothetical protein